MSRISIGAMNQLADALESAGWTAEDITRLKQFSELPKIKDVLFGKALISYPEDLIDCDATPFIPNDWMVEEHRKCGRLRFDATKVSLYLSNKQKKGIIIGHDLLKELLGKPVMNANVLDHLLAHQEFIPEEWKNKYVFFWGTIYCDANGYLYVRYLDWNFCSWIWRYYRLDVNLNHLSFAALMN